MPILIVEQPGKRTGGPITGRVLIGRLPTNGIVVGDSNVSRLHAWIDIDADGNHYVADSGSLTGTWVNGRAVEKRRLLGDGDVIRTGTAQTIFSLDDQLPEGVRWIDLGGLPPAENVADAGVLFDCPCGAPVWFKAAAIGQTHICRHCARTIRIPGTPGAVAETVSGATIAEPGMPPAHVRSTPHRKVQPDPVAPEVTTAAHPIDEHGLAEKPAPLFAGRHDVEAAEPATSAHSPLFAAEPPETDILENSIEELPAEPLFVPPPAADALENSIEELPAEPLFVPPPPPEPDPVITELNAALETHGEYSLEPSNGKALEAFGFQEKDEAEKGEQAGIAEEASRRESLFAHWRSEPAHETSLPAASVESAVEETPVVPIEELTVHAASEQTCSICHSPIATGEESTACPSCGLTFHADCWKENLGCSAYGCAQAGVLKPAEPAIADAPDQTTDVPVETDPVVEEDLDAAAFPWESVFLIVSVAGVLLGALAYGVPALIGAIGTAIYLAAFQDSRKRRILAIVALLVCVLGIGGGMYVSYLWWNGWPAFGTAAHRGGGL